MKFTISRDALLKPLNLVAGVVERRQTLPILANVLMVLEEDRLALTGTDLEVELVGRVQLAQPGDSGEVTVPARKLVDICKSLPEGSEIEFTARDNKVTVKSGRSRFTLATLPAREFPNVEDSLGTHKFTVKQGQLKRLIDRTGFAMAQQDVRYYLNGMLWELKDKQLRVVATDGHRLALCTLPGKIDASDHAGNVLHCHSGRKSDPDAKAKNKGGKKRTLNPRRKTLPHHSPSTHEPLSNATSHPTPERMID